MERDLSIGNLWLRSLTYGHSHSHIQHKSSIVRYVYVCSGSIRFDFDFCNPLQVNALDVVYIPSGISYISCWEDDTDALCIDLGETKKSSSIYPHIDRPGILFHDRGGALLKPLKTLENINASAEPYLWMEQVSIMMHILAEIARINASESEQRNLIQSTVLFMKINIKMDTPVETLAKMCSFSPSHYRRLFKEYYGCSPVDYRNRLRVDQARLLLTTDACCTVARAAEAVGIDDKRYFSRLYKKYTGHAPGEDRQKK